MNDEFDNSNNFPINKDVFNDYNLGSSTPKNNKRNILIPIILILAIITFVSYDGLPFNSEDGQEEKQVSLEQYKVSKKNIPSGLPLEFSPISNYYDIDIIDPEFPPSDVQGKDKVHSPDDKVHRSIEMSHVAFRGKW